jgi:hypothetical protein
MTPWPPTRRDHEVDEEGRREEMLEGERVTHSYVLNNGRMPRFCSGSKRSETDHEGHVAWQM